jgi:hypothetical protein
VHDAEQAVIVERLEPRQDRVKCVFVVDLEAVVPGNGELRAKAVVRIVADGDHRIQAVVPPRHLHNDEDMILGDARSRLHPRAFLRCDRQRASLHEARHRRRRADQGQSAMDERSTRAHRFLLHTMPLGESGVCA